MFDGYWKNPDKTAEAFKGAWCSVGDMARRDADGFIHLVDRKSNMIISGGENIYPSEVEAVLAAHPLVQDVAVIGVPDAKWGEAVTALIVAKQGASPSAEALTQLVKDRKGGTHAPKRIEIVDALPLTAVGKVDKKVLRARYWAAQDRQVN